MLNTLLDKDMSVAEKEKILSEDYDMEVDKKLGEGIGHMCNLGEGLWEDALEEGENRKLVEQVCKKMRKDKTPETIAEDLEEEMEKIHGICEIAAACAPDYDCDKVYDAWEVTIDWLAE